MENTATVVTNTMTLEEFHASKEWKSLTEGQKRWVAIFIESQDAKRATAEAYDSDDESYVAMFTRKIESSTNVIAALDTFYQRSPRERFIRDLELNIRNSTGVARIEALKLYARITGLDAPNGEPVCKVGDVVLADGVQHRVTAVDTNGKPLEGEPL